MVQRSTNSQRESAVVPSTPPGHSLLSEGTSVRVQGSRGAKRSLEISLESSARKTRKALCI